MTTAMGLRAHTTTHEHKGRHYVAGKIGRRTADSRKRRWTPKRVFAVCATGAGVVLAAWLVVAVVHSDMGKTLLPSLVLRALPARLGLPETAWQTSHRFSQNATDCDGFGAQRDPYFQLRDGEACAEMLFQGNEQFLSTKLSLVYKLFASEQQCTDYYVRFWGLHLHDPLPPAFYSNVTEMIGLPGSQTQAFGWLPSMWRPKMPTIEAAQQQHVVFVHRIGPLFVVLHGEQEFQQGVDPTLLLKWMSMVKREVDEHSMRRLPSAVSVMLRSFLLDPLDCKLTSLAMVTSAAVGTFNAQVFYAATVIASTLSTASSLTLAMIASTVCCCAVVCVFVALGPAGRDALLAVAVERMRVCARLFAARAPSNKPKQVAQSKHRVDDIARRRSSGKLSRRGSFAAKAAASPTVTLPPEVGAPPPTHAAPAAATDTHPTPTAASQQQAGRDDDITTPEPQQEHELRQPKQHQKKRRRSNSKRTTLPTPSQTAPVVAAAVVAVSQSNITTSIGDTPQVGGGGGDNDDDNDNGFVQVAPSRSKRRHKRKTIDGPEQQPKEQQSQQQQPPKQYTPPPPPQHEDDTETETRPTTEQALSSSSSLSSNNKAAPVLAPQGTHHSLPTSRPTDFHRTQAAAAAAATATATTTVPATAAATAAATVAAAAPASTAHRAAPAPWAGAGTRRKLVFCGGDDDEPRTVRSEADETWPPSNADDACRTPPQEPIADLQHQTEAGKQPSPAAPKPKKKRQGKGKQSRRKTVSSQNTAPTAVSNPLDPKATTFFPQQVAPQLVMAQSAVDGSTILVPVVFFQPQPVA